MKGRLPTVVWFGLVRINRPHLYHFELYLSLCLRLNTNYSFVWHLAEKFSIFFFSSSFQDTSSSSQKFNIDYCHDILGANLHIWWCAHDPLNVNGNCIDMSTCRWIKCYQRWHAASRQLSIQLCAGEREQGNEHCFMQCQWDFQFTHGSIEMGNVSHNRKLAHQTGKLEREKWATGWIYLVCHTSHVIDGDGDDDVPKEHQYTVIATEWVWAKLHENLKFEIERKKTFYTVCVIFGVMKRKKSMTWFVNEWKRRDAGDNATNLVSEANIIIFSFE